MMISFSSPFFVSPSTPQRDNNLHWINVHPTHTTGRSSCRHTDKYELNQLVRQMKPHLRRSCCFGKRHLLHVAHLVHPPPPPPTTETAISTRFAFEIDDIRGQQGDGRRYHRRRQAETAQLTAGIHSSKTVRKKCRYGFPLLENRLLFSLECCNAISKIVYPLCYISQNNKVRILPFSIRLWF